MAQFDIPEPFEIPFFDHGNTLAETIKNSSQRRKMSKTHFIFRKIKNILLYRLAFFCPLNSWRIKMHRWRGIHIGEHCYIAQQCSLDNAYPELIFIEDYAGINQGTTIITHTNCRDVFKGVVKCVAAPVVVRKYALVSVNCTLLPGVEIGEKAIVSAGSVVTNKVKPDTMVIGNPAKKLVNFEKMLEKA